MKKEGEASKPHFVRAVFISLIVISLAVMIFYGPNMTGYAILDPDTAQQKLESALQSSSIFSGVLQANLCVVINDPEQPVTLHAQKTTDGWKVTQTTGFCRGLTAEDVVVQFPDYDSYSSIVNNPTPRNIASGAKNQVFPVLESKYVEPGGNVICDAAFKVKYCTALTAMASPEELIEGDLVCCLDTLTKEQRKLLETHLQQGNYKDEIGIIQKPSSTSLFSSSIAMIGGGGFIAILLIIVFVMMIKGKSGKKIPAGTAGAVSGSGATSAGETISGGAVPGIGATGIGTFQPVPAEAPQTLDAYMMRTSSEPPEVTQLRGYVKQVLLQGYDPEQIRGHLIEIGWESDTADKVLLEAYKQAQKEISAG